MDELILGDLSLAQIQDRPCEIILGDPDHREAGKVEDDPEAEPGTEEREEMPSTRGQWGRRMRKGLGRMDGGSSERRGEARIW